MTLQQEGQPAYQACLRGQQVNVLVLAGRYAETGLVGSPDIMCFQESIYRCNAGSELTCKVLILVITDRACQRQVIVD
jgi:hypothetical protein